MTSHSLPALSMLIAALAQSPELLSWNAVVAQHDVAYTLYRQEQRHPTGLITAQWEWERMQAFRKAAALLTSYMRNYVRNVDSKEGLLAEFRLGTYMELAGWEREAIAHYQFCLSHPKIKDRRIRYNDEPVVDQVTAREADLRAKLAPEHRTIAMFRGKDDITPRVLDPPGVIPASKTHEVAMRYGIGETLHDTAVRAVQAISKHPSLKQVCLDESGPDFVVIAIQCKPEQANKLADFVRRLELQFREDYLGRRGVTPNLTIFANFMSVPTDEARGVHTTVTWETVTLGPRERDPFGYGPTTEDIGAALSSVLHWRTTRGLEAYYEALDHSVVLRRGLADGVGNLFFGTAAHEVIHALINTDFPNAPLWLSEGLATMHESAAAGVPTDNYRLYVARETIRHKRFPPLSLLLDGNYPGWRDERSYALAAASRYLCIYLQQAGGASNNLLRQLYQNIRDNAEARKKKTGDEVLTSIMGLPLREVEASLQEFILSRDVSGVDRDWAVVRPGAQQYVAKLVSW